jgi:hypothetical protein
MHRENQVISGTRGATSGWNCTHWLAEYPGKKASYWAKIPAEYPVKKLKAFVAKNLTTPKPWQHARGVPQGLRWKVGTFRGLDLVDVHDPQHRSHVLAGQGEEDRGRLGGREPFYIDHHIAEAPEALHVALHLGHRDDHGGAIPAAVSEVLLSEKSTKLAVICTKKEQ